MPFLLSRQDSPLGSMLIVTDAQENLRALDFYDYESRLHTLLTRHYGAYELQNAPTPAKIENALAHYFTGDLSAIEDLSVCTGGTPFQRDIWKALRSIPAGVTKSYGELARQVGKPNASRAVGLANGANPIAIVVPCHRIIGATGALTGYGGGLPRKRWLLEHEQKHAAVFAV
ncbi:methylated-DNA--[protein]-cysteine S-methyltransferase [Blastopirellula marina]|uniref:Methylated-DNA--protein-cysteine methyltransferase n=1 Tax=Blastopirellula marina DSM 3645 TaxID=314230 RepID=A3ZWC3_9BACT|nr:methylated-DNA--[protein]-cysteine S-methyltransferase [Blastopirellula marina]EAQ79151.1 methylated-DNA--protein-cysteine methyltransferase [Blastopirellula marina DSM 3645]